jgi:hypothetical protein
MSWPDEVDALNGIVISNQWSWRGAALQIFQLLCHVMDYSVPSQRTFVEAAPARVARSTDTSSFTALNPAPRGELPSTKHSHPFDALSACSGQASHQSRLTASSPSAVVSPPSVPRTAPGRHLVDRVLAGRGWLRRGPRPHHPNDES